MAAWHVYFVSDGEFLKIGRARDVDARIKTMQTGNARELRLVAVIPHATERTAADTEAHLHRRLRKHRVRGEWFEAHALALADGQTCIPVRRIRSSDKKHDRDMRTKSKRHLPIRPTCGIVVTTEPHNQRRNQRSINGNEPMTKRDPIKVADSPR